MSASAARTDAHESRLAELRRTTREAIASALPAGAGAVALVDFPSHANIGDSAIWAGELTTLDDLGVRVAYACDRLSYRPARLSRAIGPDAPILLHGGGNFGDVWPDFHAFRERVIADFPGRPILQLPQSIAFSSGGAAERTRAVLAAHGGVTLLVRDRPSLRFAEATLGADARLCPDMALALRAPGQRRPAHLIAWLHREDRERASATRPPTPPGAIGFDWPQDRLSRLLRNAGRVQGHALAPLPGLGALGAGLLGRAYRSHAQRRVAAGMALLAQGRVVVTDRLHAHILAFLQGIPSVLVDNSYGKLERFVEAWTAPSPLVELAGSHEAALSRAATIAAART